MPRPFKHRRVCCNPDANYFKPRGIPVSELEEINLTMDELEAVRLADFNGLYQEDAAKKMNISRQTFGNIINSARKKIADALLNAKALKIKGGVVKMMEKHFNNSNTIQLLAIRGARMMGSDRSIINYLISNLPKSWEGEIQILLLDPDSEYLKERALELKKRDPADFAIECKSSIRNIFTLQDRYNVNVEVRIYDRKPIIRTIIFDDLALLSYYIGEKGHIPFQYDIRKGSNSSLFRMIKLIYNDLWLNSKIVKKGTI